VPFFRDPTKKHWPHPALTDMWGAVSIRTNYWRVTSYPTGEQELFDITADPTDQVNQAYNRAFAGHLSAINAQLDVEVARWRGKNCQSMGSATYIGSNQVRQTRSPFCRAGLFRRLNVTEDR
jgi:hypothetical protein